MWDSWPDPLAAAELFRRLAAGDAIASSDLAAAYMDLLADYLRTQDPSADEHDRFTAAGDALLSLIRRHEIYDPSRLELGAFLRMAARADLANIRNAERRRQQKREDRDCVELSRDDGNNSSDATDLPSFDDPVLAEVIAAFTPMERQVFDLMRAGEHRTEVFAAVMGITGLSLDEQKREVKKVKERIMKRLQRAGGRT